ncbi:hypothetical protein YC2023_011790 [Brassica napus]
MWNTRSSKYTLTTHPKKQSRTKGLVYSRESSHILLSYSRRGETTMKIKPALSHLVKELKDSD